MPTKLICDIEEILIDGRGHTWRSVESPSAGSCAKYHHHRVFSFVVICSAGNVCVASELNSSQKLYQSRTALSR